MESWLLKCKILDSYNILYSFRIVLSYVNQIFIDLLHLLKYELFKSTFVKIPNYIKNLIDPGQSYYKHFLWVQMLILCKVNVN